MIWTCPGTCIYVAPTRVNKIKSSTIRYVPCSKCCGYRTVRRRTK